MSHSCVWKYQGLVNPGDNEEGPKAKKFTKMYQTVQKITSHKTKRIGYEPFLWPHVQQVFFNYYLLNIYILVIILKVFSVYTM